MGILTTGGVEVPSTAANTHSHNNALDATPTILCQQCPDMQLDVGQNIVRISCVECCVKLLEFAHTSARVCVSCTSSSDAPDSFAECFIGCLRGRRVTATRVLQHCTSLRKFFVLGGLVPAMLLARWWIRPPSMTGRVGNPTTVVKNIRSSHVHIFSHHLDTVLPTHVRSHSHVSCPPKGSQTKLCFVST